MVAILEIKRISLDEINPAKYNPRKDLKPGDPEYEKLKKSMEIFAMWNSSFGTGKRAISYRDTKDQNITVLGKD